MINSLSCGILLQLVELGRVFGDLGFQVLENLIGALSITLYRNEVFT